jgi:hypothetical protein
MIIHLGILIWRFRDYERDARLEPPPQWSVEKQPTVVRSKPANGWGVARFANSTNVASWRATVFFRMCGGGPEISFGSGKTVGFELYGFGCGVLANEYEVPIVGDNDLAVFDPVAADLFAISRRDVR